MRCPLRQVTECVSLGNWEPTAAFEARKPESQTADLCAGKAHAGRVFVQEPPVGQELLTLVSILPPRCCKVSIKVCQS